MAEDSDVQNIMIQVPRKVKVQTSEIVWSGDAWICSNDFKHFPAFRRNGTSITLHSFVFINIMAEDGIHYICYVEDLYEDNKGHKKVKVRWFHHGKEVEAVVTQLNPHPREVIVTPIVQVISAGCIDGPATVLTPMHYEKYANHISETLMAGIHICFRQFKKSKVKPFCLSDLAGYSNQAILSSIDCDLVPKNISKDQKEEEKFTLEEPTKRLAKRTRSSRKQKRLENGPSEVAISDPEKQIAQNEPTNRKSETKEPIGDRDIEPMPLHQASSKVSKNVEQLCQDNGIRAETKLPSTEPIGVQVVEPASRHQASSKISKKIELLCQDSGIRGCWFRCTVLKTSPKFLKVRYIDVEDADGPGKLEEWVHAVKEADPDKLAMRYSGRLTIRPWPLEDSPNCSFEVGAAVDAWWCAGWWEGVVTGVDASGSNNIQVYLPGESKFLTVQRKDMRTSREWVYNKWMDIKAKPVVISFIPSSIFPKVKLRMVSNLADASKRGGSASVNHKVVTFSEPAVEGKTKEPPGSAAADKMENVSVNLKKQLRVSGDNKCDKGVRSCAAGKQVRQ